MDTNKNINNTIEVYARDFPGDSIGLEFTSPESWSQTELTKFTVDSFFSFADGWVEILTAELSLIYYDIESYTQKESCPSQEFWMLKKRQINPQVRLRQFWENEIIVDADEITSLTISEWITHALAANEPAAPGFGLTWEQIMFNIVNCDSGLKDYEYGKEIILVTEGVRKYEDPFPFETRDGNIWITGPLQKKSLDAPIEFTLTNYGGRVSLDISVYWSLWSKEGMPGTLKVQESVNKLLQQGWVYASY